MGNHGSYADRYPHQFAKFQGRGKQIDAYDNSILYNDYVVSKIYDSASKLPYFQSLIYFSDHTDAVDQGLAHDSGNFVYPMTYIPMYMFFSPDYKAEHETTFNNLKFHQAAVFTNDLIFNTILGVMNIKFPPIYEEKMISRPISTTIHLPDSRHYTELKLFSHILTTMPSLSSFLTDCLLK